MKRLIFAILLSALAVAAHAGPYIGAKAGLIVNETALPDDVTVDFEDVINAGVYGGYEFTTAPRVGFEAEWTTTVSEEEFRAESQTVSVAGEWEIETIGLFGVVRGGEQIYGKFRAGWVYNDIQGNFDVPNLELQADEVNGSAGVGIGWMLPAGRVELEYTQVDSDLHFFSLGYLF